MRDAIHDGVGMVAAYMGESIVTKELTVRVPTSPAGLVDPHRIGFSKMDKMVELHLLALPLDVSTEQVGLAYKKRGIGFVDTTAASEAFTRGVVAHETAHALGFVDDDADHKHSASNSHCNDASCIMHPVIAITLDTIEAEATQSRLERMMRRKPKIISDTVVRLANNQVDFCFDCKVDLRGKGQAHLDSIRQDRLFGSKAI